MQNFLLLGAFSGFASGILCRSLFIFSWHVSALLLLFAAALFSIWCVRRRAFFVVCAVFLVAAALGSARVMLAPSTLPDAFVPLLGKEVQLEGTVIAEPDVRETTQRITLRVEKDGVQTKVLVVAPLYPAVAYGERVRAEGTLALPEPFETEGGRMFRYDQFLAKDGVFALVKFASVRTLAEPSGMSVFQGTLIRAKHWFQEGLARALPEPSASLASGLITGGKQGLGASLLDAFIIAGLVHIVVLSGYNVMIVAEAVMLTSFRVFSRRTAAGLAALAVLLFVLAAGAGAASVRAGLMAGLALLARATGQTYAVVRALLVVAALMLLANPLLLAFDPGFQLSFVATLGLILLAPILEARLSFVRSVFWRELLAASLAAQVAVLPLLLYQTGLFSFVSLPANLLVLPLVPPAMALAAIAGFAGALVPAVAPLAGYPAYLLLSYVIAVAEFSAGLPLASLYVPQFPFLLVVLAYGALGLLIVKSLPGRGGFKEAIA